MVVRWLGKCIMRTYVAPIGYNPTTVIRPVLSHGLDTGDAITLLRPTADTDDRRAREAVTDIERTVGELEPDILVETERIPHEDLQTAVLACSDTLQAASGRIIAIFGGGARDVFLPFTVASLTYADCIETVLTFSDVDGAVRESVLPRLTARPPEPTWETLMTIDRANETSIPALTEDTGQSKSTVTRHVTQLAERGLVETWMDGKTKWARVAFTGRLLLRARNSDMID